MSTAIAFIGSAGIPNRYGGFESFLEHCGPAIARLGHPVTVTCDARLYPDRAATYNGVRRRFISVPANGGASVLHDLVAFAAVFNEHSKIVVLGVSGGLWFPLFRLLCDLMGKQLVVNIDGVEWRRTKFSVGKRRLLKVLDGLAQRFSHRVIYDNPGLETFLTESARRKALCIAYPGDHVKRVAGLGTERGTALTICRIEPENNLEMLIDGALQSELCRYTIVGNWEHSDYARSLRQRYAMEARLELLDPIYDPDQLAHLRESSAVYLHGHSVGGTNPSLVEILFYDCRVLCFDVAFNRHTAGPAAEYFQDGPSLARLIDRPPAQTAQHRQACRAQYSASRIAQQYLDAVQSTPP